MNIVTGMDTFIQLPKSVTKTNSVEKLEEKRRHEEDARKKREEALRLQTEEKRRYIKILKCKKYAIIEIIFRVYILCI